MTTEREKKLEDALAQFIKPMKGLPFEVVIKALCGVEVIKYDTEKSANEVMLSNIVDAMRSACRTVQNNPIIRTRPNEVGNDMEPFVIQALSEMGLKAQTPRTLTGKGKSMGYPDARIEHSDYPVYFEVKTYAAKNHATTQRSFYLSPSEDSKVIEDAYHILVGFEIERNGNNYVPVGFDIVDLYGLDCDMKSEFNSDNKRLYEAHRLLARELVPIEN